MISASSELNKNHTAKDGRISYTTDRRRCDNYLCYQWKNEMKILTTTARRMEKEGWEAHFFKLKGSGFHANVSG